MFADRATITIISGKGGDGHVSFRREKYVPNGGPDGGDGGDGGSIIFEIDEGLNTLTDFRHKRKFKATPGEEGKKRNSHGKKGEDLILKVPAGTIIRDAASGKVIADMSADNKRVVVLEGGKGGLGNQHFATSRMQAPKYAKPGGDAIELEVTLELKVIADVGLVGFPNVGKSTFLSRVTNAKPKIANYHFTTLSPNLGVVDIGDDGFVIADIPGLIEGASDGLGLGHDFLRHIQRTKIILHIVDGASVEGRDPIEDIEAINKELLKYDEHIMEKPHIIVANKMDVCSDEEKDQLIKKLKDKYGVDTDIFTMSAVTGDGVESLIYRLSDVLKELPKEIFVYEPEFTMDDIITNIDLPVSVFIDDEGNYRVEGPKIEKMLGYTNIDSEKGNLFFQKFLKEQGILSDLEKLGIEDGDTVQMYGWSFEYYK